MRPAWRRRAFRGIKATFGEVRAQRMDKGTTRVVILGEHVFMSFNENLRDGKMVRDPIRLDDASDTERYGKLNKNAQYWTARRADQMNYRYWKDRCTAAADSAKASKRTRAVLQRNSGFTRTAISPRPPRNLGKGSTSGRGVLAKYPAYRDDDLNKKDTGLVVKRYVQVCWRKQGDADPRELSVQGTLRELPWADSRKARSTRSTCSK